MTTLLQGLNDAQKEAVTTTEGPLLIIAGPGTGKTLTLVRRIAYLIRQGIAPESILAVTFTNRAAREMRERAEAMIGKEADRVFICTFHSLGLTIMQELADTAPVIYSRTDQMYLMQTLMNAPVKEMEQALEQISRIKNLCAEPAEDIQDIHAAYETCLRKNNALDLDDLILRPAELLAQGDIQEKFWSRFRYIMVDEYQDINPAQYRLLRLLAEDKGNLCVVGDADQAIYGFRGADLTNFLSFTTDFPGAGAITLRENYRSTATIVRASDSMIRRNRGRLEKELVSTGCEGGRSLSSLRLTKRPRERR